MFRLHSGGHLLSGVGRRSWPTHAPEASCLRSVRTHRHGIRRPVPGCLGVITYDLRYLTQRFGSSGEKGWWIPQFRIGLTIVLDADTYALSCFSFSGPAQSGLALTLYWVKSLTFNRHWIDK